MKYRVIVTEVSEFDETVDTYQDPETGKVYRYKYDLPQEVQERLKIQRITTGKKTTEEKEIFDQAVDNLDLTKVIKAVNNIE